MQIVCYFVQHLSGYRKYGHWRTPLIEIKLKKKKSPYIYFQELFQGKKKKKNLTSHKYGFYISKE